MNVHWDIGTVVQTCGYEPGVQYVKVRRQHNRTEERAIHYTDGQLLLAEGDEVVLNTTAVDLSLGSGGQHFVAWKMNHLPANEPLEGHIMKLRYTPWQFSVLSAEEQGSSYHDQLKNKTSLEGIPVLAGELHSMLPILVTSLQWIAKHHGSQLRIAYVMTDGAALPIRFSRHVQSLQRQEWLAGTVTVGHAYGGDLEAVNVYSGLLTARHVLKADVAIVLMGPGIVGTGTTFGFTGIEQGQIVNAAHALGGVPIVVPRISFADQRERHQGISHHTMTNLTRVIMRSTRIALPLYTKQDWQQYVERQCAKMEEDGARHDWIRVPLDEEELKTRLENYPHRITSMGRGMTDDLAFFLAVSCAADVAWQAIHLT